MGDAPEECYLRGREAEREQQYAELQQKNVELQQQLDQKDQEYNDIVNRAEQHRVDCDEGQARFKKKCAYTLEVERARCAQELTRMEQDCKQEVDSIKQSCAGKVAAVRSRMKAMVNGAERVVAKCVKSPQQTVTHKNAPAAAHEGPQVVQQPQTINSTMLQVQGTAQVLLKFYVLLLSRVLSRVLSFSGSTIMHHDTCGQLAPSPTRNDTYQSM